MYNSFMSATIQYKTVTATIDRGIWKSDDPALARRLQEFRDSLAGNLYTLAPDHFDSLDAIGAVDHLGPDAKIIRSDPDLPETSDPDEIH